MTTALVKITGPTEFVLVKEKPDPQDHNEDVTRLICKGRAYFKRWKKQ